MKLCRPSCIKNCERNIGCISNLIGWLITFLCTLLMLGYNFFMLIVEKTLFKLYLDTLPLTIDMYWSFFFFFRGDMICFIFSSRFLGCVMVWLNVYLCICTYCMCAVFSLQLCLAPSSQEDKYVVTGLLCVAP